MTESLRLVEKEKIVMIVESRGDLSQTCKAKQRISPVSSSFIDFIDRQHVHMLKSLAKEGMCILVLLTLYENVYHLKEHRIVW